MELFLSCTYMALYETKNMMVNTENGALKVRSRKIRMEIVNVSFTQTDSLLRWYALMFCSR
jgi:hypothetical protein